MNTVDLIGKKDCCGCTACVFVCPVKAISLRADEQGFAYPFIDKEKCIDCGACLRTHNGIADKKRGVISAYAVKNADENALLLSSSGGVSAAIAKTVSDIGGIVYGVVFDEDHKVVTKRFEKCDDKSALFGSKYVQTDLNDTFEKCLFDLENGKDVAFFATSCHIAGLYAFLDEKRCSTERLLTIDLICHGVPSPKLFADYIDWLKEKKSFYKFDFRTKEKPWGLGSKNFGSRITYRERGKEIKEVDSLRSRVFLRLFFSNNCLREHCYNCPYASAFKPADLTVADYWGCKENEPAFFSEKGVSAVLVHTKKGEDLLTSLKGAVIKKTTVDKIAEKQTNLSHPTLPAKTREKFWELYHKKGFIAVAKSYGGYKFGPRLKRFLSNLFGK